MSSAAVAAGGAKEQRRVGLFRGLAQQIAARAFILSGRRHTTEGMGRQESLLLAGWLVSENEKRTTRSVLACIWGVDGIVDWRFVCELRGRSATEALLYGNDG